MNRRVLAFIVLLIAVPLFAAPLVAPIPNPEPLVTVSIGPAEPDPVPAEYGHVSQTTYRYQNLSAAAQHFFDTQNASDDETHLPPETVPAPWASRVNATASAIATTDGQVVKDGQYYPMYVGMVTPQPPLSAVMPRFGALIAAIGLGDLAGYFFLTAVT